MAEPFGLVGMFVNVKAGDEGLVAATMTMVSRLAIITTSIRFNTAIMMVFSSMMLKLDTKCHNDLRNLQA